MSTAFVTFLLLFLILRKDDLVLSHFVDTACAAELKLVNVPEFFIKLHFVDNYGDSYNASFTATSTCPCTSPLVAASLGLSYSDGSSVTQHPEDAFASPFTRSTFSASDCPRSKKDGFRTQRTLEVHSMQTVSQAHVGFLPSVPNSLAANYGPCLHSWTEAGRRAKSANRQQEGPGPPMMQYHSAPPQVPPSAQGKGAFLAPPPPPNVPWPGYGMAGQTMNPPMVFTPAQPQMIPQMMHMGPPPHMPQQHSQQPVTAPCAPVAMQHPAPPVVASANATVMDAETKEFVELARARQSELPEDMRKKVQQLSKKEGAKATRNFHSAVRLQGLARSELEEALQARANLISSWRTFIAEAVKTWQDHTSLFQAQEIELQDRIQQAQKKFAEAKTIVEETKEEAGKVSTTIEVHDTDDEELMKDRETATSSTVKIKNSLLHLTSSLQQLHEQAMTIDSEEKATKRPRTSSPRIEDLDMDNKLDATSGLSAPATSF
eukprot:s4069_g2.t1